MVLSWLLNSLSENIRNSVMYFDTALELWNDLDERFGQSNKARLFQVQKDVSCLSQGDLDIASYYTKAKQLWDESHAVSGIPLCTCTKCECEVNNRLHKYTEERKLIQFLMGLNSSYTAIRGNILMMVPFPTISQAYSLLVQEERQRLVKSETHFLSDNASLSVAVVSKQTIQQDRQEPWRDGQKKTDSKRSQLFCDHCERTSHSIDKCHRLHGFPSSSNRFQGKGRGGQGPAGSARKAYNTWSESDQQQGSLETPTPNLPSLNAE